MSTNITDTITNNAKNIPDYIAVYMDNQSYTYKELEELVLKTTSFLHLNNINQNDILAMTFENEFTYLLIILATAKLGATVFSISESNTFLLSEDMIKSSKSKFLISDIKNKTSNLIPTLYADFETLNNINPLINKDLHNTNPTAPWVIIKGTGTTGKSKLIPIYHNQQIERMKSAFSWLPLKEKDIITSFVSMDFNVSKRFYLEAFFAKLSIVLYNKSSAIFDILKNYNLSMLHTTVSHINNILKLDLQNKKIMDSLKVLLVGGSSVSESLRDLINKNLSSNLYIHYGSNEIGTIASLFQSNNSHIKNSVGFPIKNIEVQIVDENNNLKAKDEIGIIRIKSKGAITNYLDDKEATKKAINNNWFYPGDLGKFSNNNELIHMGRADSMMIINGVNIYPIEIEQLFLSHPQIKEAVCISFKSNFNQDIPVCAVVLYENSNLTQNDIWNYAFQYLGLKTPKKVVILDTIPLNEQGKVIREEVKNKILKLNNKFHQKMEQFNINLNSNITIDLKQIDLWLINVLNINIEKYSNNSDIFLFVQRILLLTKELLQAIKIPVFDNGEILDIYQNNENELIITINIVSIDYIPKDLYISIINSSLNILLDFIKNPISPQNIQKLFKLIETQIINPFSQISGSGKSTLPVLKVAYEKHIPFKHLSAGVYQLGWGSKAKRINRSVIEQDSAIGSQMAQNKIITAMLLKNAGLPSSEHKVVLAFEEALSVAKEFSVPLVVKPADQDRGEGVSINIKNDKQLLEAFNIAKEASLSKQIIIEKEVKGVCCRIFIVNNKLLYAVKRLPKSIVGNGINSVKEIIHIVNEIELNTPPWKRNEFFPMDELAIKSINKAGFTLYSIPKINQLVPLRDIESTQWGGFDEDITNLIHPDNLNIAIKAAKLFGLCVAGIDIITPDISIPWYKNNAIINEVNFSPLLGGGDISKKAIPDYLNEFIKDDGRIPITVILGDDKAMNCALKVQKDEINKNLNTFITSHNKTLSYDNKEIFLSANTLWERCQALLFDSKVDSLILVVQTDELLFNKLPIDCFDKIIIASQYLYSWKNEQKKVETHDLIKIIELLSSQDRSNFV